VSCCATTPQNAPSAERSLDGWVHGLPPSGYRITAHDGHLASCDENKQAITPVGVSPMRFSAVSYIGAFCFNMVVSSNSGQKTVKIVVSFGHVGTEKALRGWCY
jgi:hypothetical protein